MCECYHGPKYCRCLDSPTCDQLADGKWVCTAINVDNTPKGREKRAKKIDKMFGFIAYTLNKCIQENIKSLR